MGNKHIQPETFYSSRQIIKLGYFSWIKSMMTLVKWIEYDKNHDNILKANVTGYNTGRRYYIKGENIIKFIAMFEDGSLHMDIRKEVVKMDEQETTTEEQANTAVEEAQAETNEDTSETVSE